MRRRSNSARRRGQVEIRAPWCWERIHPPCILKYFIINNISAMVNSYPEINSYVVSLDESLYVLRRWRLVEVISVIHHINLSLWTFSFSSHGTLSVGLVGLDVYNYTDWPNQNNQRIGNIAILNSSNMIESPPLTQGNLCAYKTAQGNMEPHPAEHADFIQRIGTMGWFDLLLHICTHDYGWSTPSTYLYSDNLEEGFCLIPANHQQESSFTFHPHNFDKKWQFLLGRNTNHINFYMITVPLCNGCCHSSWTIACCRRNLISNLAGYVFSFWFKVFITFQSMALLLVGIAYCTDEYEEGCFALIQAYSKV